MKRLLVTGASGFIGGRLAAALASRFRVETRRAELTDPAALRALFDDARPDVVAHCAAIADPDTCEKDPARAFAVNEKGACLVARLCAERGARLVHVSTDLVFDGSAAPYGEDAEPSPMSVYGRAKLAGEAAVLAADPTAAVVRVALVYGRSLAGRKGFLDWLLGELRAGRRARLFVDQFRTPTPMSQLPEVVERLAETPAAGVFHWAGAERVSRLDFGRAVCRVFGLDAGLLDGVKLADFGYAAARPRDCSLTCARLSGVVGLSPLALEAGLSAER